MILVAYYITPSKYKNGTLLIGSLIFYFAGEPKYTLLLAFSAWIDYMHSWAIERNRGRKLAKIILISSIAINLAILGFFKYSDFIIQNINRFCHTDFQLLGLGLPIGISFFTFQTMSYTIDVYRGECKSVKSPIGLLTYVALFPQLIAGPIIRYKTIADELQKRKHSFENFAYGVKRFTLGLGKKVLLANGLRELASRVSTTTAPSVSYYWMGAVAFSLQIYFDFSGYSDMAIGLASMFGFHFMENFNYPYISKSISEFWNRWHISLGMWFKDYVYIPLGGNRVNKLKWFRNILVVWLLTGLWHGASWNFILWGLYYALLLILEKGGLLTLLEKLPSGIRHIYVVLSIIFGFVIFNHTSLNEVKTYFLGMFGGLNLPLTSLESTYYFKSYWLLLLVGTIGSTPMVRDLYTKAIKLPRVSVGLQVAEPLIYVVLLMIITGYLVDASFNPFLYYRF
jgi:alginate O-acetyltransferase complex protein AlgI